MEIPLLILDKDFTVLRALGLKDDGITTDKDFFWTWFRFSL